MPPATPGVPLREVARPRREQQVSCPCRRSGSLSEHLSPVILTLLLLDSSGLGCRPESPSSVLSEDVTLSIGYTLPAREGAPAVGVREAVALITNEGLLRPGPDGRHEPRLARSWRWVDDGATLQIDLRDDVTFHDGVALTAGAVKESLDRSRASPAQMFRYPVLGDISAIEAPAPDTLLIHAGERSMLLLDDLEVAITKVSADGRPVGTGSFVVESETATVTTLVAHAGNRRTRPEIDRIRILTYPTARAAWVSLMRGDIDALYQVPTDALEFVEAESSIRVFSFLRPYAYSLVFNTARLPFRSARLRRALSHAVDRQQLIDWVFKGRGTSATGHVWPHHWAYHGDPSAYRYDATQANRLLADAGFPMPSAEEAPPRDRMPARMRFVCLVASDVWPYESVAILLQKQLSDVGIDMQIEPVSVEQLNQQIQAGDYDVVVLDLNGGPGLVRPFAFWRSSPERRPWQFGYNGADQALDVLRQASTETALRQAAQEFQRVIQEDPPAIFLAWPETARAVSRRFHVPPTDRDVLATIAEWRVAAGSADEQG